MAERICPPWIGYLLASPLRRLFENPEKMLGDYVRPGMTILDAGSAMGFFSLAMARMVGPEGKIYAVDLQEKMIKSLKRRAAKAGVSDIIEARTCNQNSLEINDLTGKIDFAVAIHVVHEVPDASNFISEIYSALKPGAKFLIIEPKGHASPEGFAATEKAAVQAGFEIVDHPKIKRDWTVMLVRNT